MSVRRLTLGVGVFVAFAGCQKGEPVEAFLRFLDAVNERDAEAAWKGISADSQKALEAQASKLKAAGVERKARDLLLITGLNAKRSKRDVTVVRADDSVTELKVALESGGEDAVTMVKEGGAWKVRLPRAGDPMPPLIVPDGGPAAR